MLFSLPAVPVLAGPADFDFGFGPGGANPRGTAFGPAGSDGWNARALAVQGDGKIVAAGALLNDFFVARYRVDGTPDPDFGSGGKVKVTLPIPATPNGMRAEKAILQPDGKILAVAGLMESGGYGIKTELFRFMPDGTPDASFGAGGRVPDGPPETARGVHDCVLQSDGKILVLGQTKNPYAIQISLVRYLPDGSRDTGYGTNGEVVIPQDPATAMALLPGDGILLAGSSTGGHRLIRLDANGVPDSAFGTGGTVTGTSVPGRLSHPWDMAVQSDGKIVVAGTNYLLGSGNGVMVSRYLPDGSPDLTFNGTGSVVSDITSGTIGSANSTGMALAVQSDGKVVVSGWAGFWGGVVRYLPNGHLDPSFGTSGFIFTWEETVNHLYAVALQPDGMIVVSGEMENPVRHTVLARLCGDSTGLIAEKQPGIPFGYGESLNLGSVLRTSGLQLSGTVTLKNTAEVPLSGLTATLTGDDAGRFTFTTTLPDTLAPGASVPVTLSYTAGHVSDTSVATLTITSREPVVIGVSVRIQAATVPAMSILELTDGPTVLKEVDSGVNFGAGVVGALVTRTLTAWNRGNFDLELQRISVPARGNNGDFAAGPAATTTLAPGESTTFDITFTASAPGLRTGFVEVVSSDTFTPSLTIPLTGIGVSALIAWRETHFHTTVGEGDAADLSDPDKDGVPNLLEFATFTDPLEHNSRTDATALKLNGDKLEYTFHRPATASAAVSYALEWSDLTAPWTTEGVTEEIVNIDSTRQQVKYTLDAGSAGKRFVRLSVTAK
jgi:uncharacterized delta-60 repeat protein